MSIFYRGLRGRLSSPFWQKTPYLLRGNYFPWTPCSKKLIQAFFFFIVPTLVYSQSTIPYKLRDIGVTEKLGTVVSLNYQFKDPVLDKIVSLDHFFREGKPVLLSFVYYSCPMLCNFITTGLVETLNQVSESTLDEITIVSISINPKDTAQQAIAFQDRYRSQLKERHPDWTFLLDHNNNIKRLAESVGFHYRLDKSGEYSHSAMLLFLSPSGTVSRYLYGINYSPLDFKLSVIESKNDTHVSTVERVLLFCYNYDPQSRKYSIYALRLMRLGGGVTIIGILFMIWKLNKKKKVVKKEEN